MNALIFTSVVAILLVTASAAGPPWQDCGSAQATISSLEVVDDGKSCDGGPCILKKGTTANITMKFKATADIPSGTNKVYGVISGVKVPFELPADACANKNMKCPIKSGEEVTYTNQIEVKTIYPSISLIVQWEVHSPTGMITCFQVPAKLE